MKPTKKRLYCPACREFKLSFETEKKAYSFIEHESENIWEENGYCPICAYKCPICACWHLTSEALVEEGFGECSVDPLEMENSRRLLGLVVRNNHTIALNLVRNVNALSKMLRKTIIDWDNVQILTQQTIEIFEKVLRTPYRYVYNVRKQWNEFLELCQLYFWRQSMISVA